MRPSHYILVGREPVPCHDFLEWARWYEAAYREDYPDRKEAIAIMLEHAKGSISWHAFITRQGERGILGNFEEHTTKIRGRFGDTLGKQSAD